MNLDQMYQAFPTIRPIVDYLESMVVASCLRAVVRLGAPDALGDGSLSLAALADKLDADESALGRVLRLLEAHAFVRLEGGVQLTERGQLLRTDVPVSVGTMFAAPGFGDAYNHLEYALRRRKATAADDEGGECAQRVVETAFEQARGIEFWKFLEANEHEARLFDENMRRQGQLLNLTSLPMLRLEGAKTVADVGGGTGSLLAAVLGQKPGVRGVLFERKDVVERAQEILRDAGLGERCSFVVGDFLNDPVPAADAYLLARVLHDWDDATATKILQAIRAAAGPSAVLNVLEMVVPQGGGRHPAKYSDITMLALFKDGRERTEEELARLLADAGWRLDEVRGGMTPTSVLVARPA